MPGVHKRVQLTANPLRSLAATDPCRSGVLRTPECGAELSLPTADLFGCALIRTPEQIRWSESLSGLQACGLSPPRLRSAPHWVKIYIYEKERIMENKPISSYHLITWHPGLHERYGEQLYFIVIKPHSYSNWFKMTLEEKLRSSGVLGWSMYEVYGFFDVMIRAWMTQEQRSLFYKAIEDDNNILEWQDIIIYEVDYLWSPIFQKKPELDDKKLNQYHPDRLDQFQSKEIDEKFSVELQNCGLVLKDIIIDVAESFNGIKFFIMIDYSSRANQADVFREIKNFIKITDHKLKELSLYSGNGFSKFIVKGLCDFDKLYDIADFSLSLISTFKILKMKSQTIIVATRRTFESDNINFNNLSFIEIQNIIKMFELSKKNISGLSRYEIRVIRDKYDEINQNGLLYEHLNLFKKLFNGYVDKDADLIKRNLFFIIDFEKYFREFSLKIMSELYGPKWVKTDFGRISALIEIDSKKIGSIRISQRFFGNDFAP